MTSRDRFSLRLIVCIARLWPVVDGVMPFINFPAHCFASDLKKKFRKVLLKQSQYRSITTQNIPLNIVISLKTRALKIKLQKETFTQQQSKFVVYITRSRDFFVFRRSFKTFISEFVRV